VVKFHADKKKIVPFARLAAFNRWMQELDDSALLREYVERDSEEAFAALVTRHVNKVYSVALRLTGNPHSAEEITQAVFVILARKSRQLGKRVILSGWLYQTARLTAVTFIRGGIRRARREQEACMQTALNENESNTWMQIAPLLDAAMAGLNEADRHAIVLRFFDGKSLREVGAALGANEEAAKKRVSRALEKLHRYFARRGVSSTTAIIAGAISANSVQAAPVTLAKAVTAIAVTKGATAGISTLTLIKGALKIMAWTKAKTAVVTGVVVLLAAGTTTLTIKEIQRHRTYSWQVPKVSHDVILNTPPQVVIVPTKFTESGGRLHNYGKGGGAMGICQPVTNIVRSAYAHDIYRMIFSPGLLEGKYDFFAKLPEPDSYFWPAALQGALKSRLGVIGKSEILETDVLLLQCKNPNAGGLKPPGSLARSLKLPNIRYISGSNSIARFFSPISDLQEFLQEMLEIPIVDQTGLKGLYDFKLTWDGSDQTQYKESIKQALLDQFGLELVPGREPVEMLVVEKVK
jgi:uncharacterized protein (TIGR03435 family)